MLHCNRPMATYYRVVVVDEAFEWPLGAILKGPALSGRPTVGGYTV